MPPGSQFEAGSPTCTSLNSVTHLARLGLNASGKFTLAALRKLVCLQKPRLTWGTLLLTMSIFRRLMSNFGQDLYIYHDARARDVPKVYIELILDTWLVLHHSNKRYACAKMR